MGSTEVKFDRILSVNEDGLIKYNGVKQTYKSSKKYYKAFASAVTAYGRVNLRKTLYKIGYNDVMYFDTDSLYTTITEEQLKERCGDIIDDYKLGMWKVERHYDRYKCIGAKQYILTQTDGQTIYKCSGLPKDLNEKIDFDNFVQGAVFKGKYKKAVKGGYDLVETFYKITEE